MTHEHLEGIFNTKLVEFYFNGKRMLMGFITMTGWFNHEHVCSRLKAQIGFLPLVARMVTHEEARNFMEHNKHLMPPTWCVPNPENGTVLLYMDNNLNVMKAGQNGVAFDQSDEVFICLETKQNSN